MMNQVAGGSLEDIQPGLDVVMTLLDNGVLVVNTSPEIQQEFAQNGAEIAPYVSDCAYTLCKAGLPAHFTLPEEGVPASFITVNLAARRDDGDLATKFIDIGISKSAQECMAEAPRYTPNSRTVELPGDVAADMVYGEDTVAKLIRFDPSTIETNRGACVDDWSRAIAR